MPLTGKIAALSLAFLAQAQQFSPTDEEFVSWVDNEPLPVRPLLYLAGPQICWEKNSPSFQAWVLESRGISFADYLVNRLSAQEYRRWVELFATSTLAEDERDKDYDLS